MITIEPITILLHAVFFFAVLFCFTRWLLRPLVAVRDARTAATDGRETNAADWVSEAARMEAAYSESILAAKVEVQALRERSREQAAARAAELLSEARGAARQALERAKSEMVRQAEECKGLLRASTEEFASMIAARLIERSVQSVDDAVVGEARRAASLGKAH